MNISVWAIQKAAVQGICTKSFAGKSLLYKYTHLIHSRPGATPIIIPWLLFWGQALKPKWCLLLRNRNQSEIFSVPKPSFLYLCTDSYVNNFVCTALGWKQHNIPNIATKEREASNKYVLCKFIDIEHTGKSEKSI